MATRPSGPNSVGDKYSRDNGQPMICTHAGSPGNWETDWASLGAPPAAPEALVLAVQNHSPTQVALQALYDGQSGQDAPDTVPAEVQAITLVNSGSWYYIYLGHNVWWYKQGQGTWTTFGGNKADFGFNVYDTVTFK